MAVMKMALETHALLLSFIVPVISIGSAFAVAIAIAPGALGVQQTEPPPIRPTPAGRALFVQSCAHCHGDDAKGSGDGSDLYGLRISNARIATVIRQGIHGEMPSFAKKYSATDIAALTTYLRTLR